MKFNANQIENFIRSPDPNIKAALLYGPDAGLVSTRSKQLRKRLLQDPSDPFSLAEITGDTLEEDPAKLMDEMKAISFSGGRRMVLISSASEGVVETIKHCLEDPTLSPDDAFLLVLAGDLTPRSKLRALFEKQPEVATLPCYQDDVRGVTQIVRNWATKTERQLEPDVLPYLQATLGGDRLQIIGSLAKLDMYLADQKQITLEDVTLCLGDAREVSLDQLCNAVSMGNTEMAMRTMHKALSQNIPPIQMLRTLSRHLQRLHFAASLMAQGQSPAEAMKQLSPPVFFKQVEAFQAQLQHWQGKTQALEQALATLYEVELASKRNDALPETLMGQAVLAIAAEYPEFLVA